MRQETRIGLLVGLGFIVAFGVVLGELTDKSPRAGQSTPLVMREVREEIFPLILEPLSEVKLTSAPPAPVAHGVAEVSPTQILRQPIAVAHAPEPLSTSPVAMLAAQVKRDPSPAAVHPEVQIYTVQPNDSLRKIARKLYGADHEEKYRVIFNANRNILDDESLVQIGQKLLIPPLADRTDHNAPNRLAAGESHQNPAETPQHRQMDLEQLREYFSAPGTKAIRRSHAGRLYVVREGDNLSMIASDTLGDDSPQAVRKLYNANQDKLNSPDLLSVGMELRIPS